MSRKVIKVVDILDKPCSTGGGEGDLGNGTESGSSGDKLTNF